jgi:hypothetical protein
MMGVTIKPTSEIKARLGLEPNGRVQKFFTSTCQKHMDKYVPMRVGNLATNLDIETDHIVYESPYAEYQYYGISKKGKPLNYSKDKHPLATSYWDKKMVSAEIQDVVKEVQAEINRGG